MNLNSLRFVVCLPLFLCFFMAVQAQDRTVSGKVTDASGKGVAGVTVSVKNATIATTSAEDGSFSLSVPADAQALLFSSVGYAPREMAITGSMLEVTLQATTVAMDEVVVIGYGTSRRRDLTGSVVNVTAKDFVKGPITTPEQLIAGKVAGVQITPNSGAPGSGSRIRVRAGTSLNASNDPLIVVDGVPLDNGGISGSANALNLINPNDIESMTVLKDASAAAIYGNRAANGVILITTKKVLPVRCG